MNELNVNFDFNLDDFDLKIDLGNSINSRYCKPKMTKSKNVKYKNAS